jgi:hypothetical protein
MWFRVQLSMWPWRPWCADRYRHRGWSWRLSESRWQSLRSSGWRGRLSGRSMTSCGVLESSWRPSALARCRCRMITLRSLRPSPTSCAAGIPAFAPAGTAMSQHAGKYSGPILTIRLPSTATRSGASISKRWIANARRFWTPGLPWVGISGALCRAQCSKPRPSLKRSTSNTERAAWAQLSLG